MVCCFSHIQNTWVQKSPCMAIHSSQVNCNASSVGRSPMDFKTAQLGNLNFQKKNVSPEDKNDVFRKLEVVIDIWIP